MNTAEAGLLLQGDTALVTGGARGNGEAIARGLVAQGASVAIVDCDGPGAEAVAASIRENGGHALAYPCDVVVSSDCKRIAEAVSADLGDVSILINNAGVIRRTPITDSAFLESFEAVFAVNVIGTANMVSACLPQLIRSKGRVINLGSIASFISTPGGGAYASSKGAVLQLTKTLAAELASQGIRVNGIAPGVIATPMTEATRNHPETAARFLAHTPMGRFGDPEELVGPVVFLASAMSSYVTGVMLPVDGGYLTL